MGGEETTSRAADLARSIGSNHTSIAIAPITAAIQQTFADCRFHSDFLDKSKVKSSVSFDGTKTEDIALQNIQARSRMAWLTSWPSSCLGPQTKAKRQGGARSWSWD